MLWIAIAGVASAEPQVETLDDGTIRGVIDLPVSTSRVRALVVDPVELGKVVSAESQVSMVPADVADCRMVTTYSPHPLMPVTYTSRDCNTAAGVTSKLVTSKQLSHFEAEWRLEPKGDNGVVVTYDLDIKTKLFPTFLVRRSTRKAVKDVLVALEESFGR